MGCKNNNLAHGFSRGNLRGVIAIPPPNSCFGPRARSRDRKGAVAKERDIGCLLEQPLPSGRGSGRDAERATGGRSRRSWRFEFPWLKPWARLFSCIVCILALAQVSAQAQSAPEDLAALSRAYVKSGSEADRSKLAEYAAKTDGPLAHLALGLGDFTAEQYNSAQAELALATTGSLADYAVYYRGRSLTLGDNLAEVAQALNGFSQRHPDSRLAAEAARLEVESLMRGERYSQAESLLQPGGSAIEEPARHFLLGRVLETQAQTQDAIRSYRRAYYYHPMSEQADQAEQRLNEIRRKLGAAYPDAPGLWRLQRAERLYAARSYTKAASEYRWAWDDLEGRDRERAVVGHGAANYRRGHTTAAYEWLRTHTVSDPELAAQRLYYVGECGRRRNRSSEFDSAAKELAASHSKSKWREQLLFSLGNHYLLKKDDAAAARYYLEVVDAFPGGAQAARAHWKLCWRAYLDRQAKAADLFEEHVEKFPNSGQASAALYWLGRLTEHDDPELARTLYAEISNRFPHYYYSYRAAERARSLERVEPRALVSTLTSKLPEPRRLADKPGAEASRLLDRGKLLYSLGFGDLAERELSSADWRSPDGHLVGIELARQRTAQGDSFRAMRHMKRYGYGYLRFSLDSLSREFWKLLFPMPWEKQLRARARPHGLDPYLVAGLIRQESEFNPRAVSRSGAIGLMQIMPSTGREIARRLGVGGFSNRRLREPDLSMRFGTYYVKQTIEQFNGRIELALAGYNAGPSRAKDWTTWEDFREPAEFVESIPFTETRNYVQAVLRNREMYKQLYGPSGSGAAE